MRGPTSGELGRRDRCVGCETGHWGGSLIIRFSLFFGEGAYTWGQGEWGIGQLPQGPAVPLLNFWKDSKSSSDWPDSFSCGVTVSASQLHTGQGPPGDLVLVGCGGPAALHF